MRYVYLGRSLTGMCFSVNILLLKYPVEISLTLMWNLLIKKSSKISMYLSEDPVVGVYLKITVFSE